MNIFWLLLGGSPFFGWWCVMVDIFWLMVGDGGCWWIYFDWWGVVGAGGRWWMVVGRSGWWHSLV